MLLLIVVVEIKQNALMCVLINYIQQGKRHNIFAGRRGGGCAFSTRCTADKRSAGSMNRFKKTNTCTRPDIVHVCSIVKRSWNSTAFYTIFAKTIKRRLCNLFDALNLFGCLRFFITRDGECWWHDRDTRRLELHYIALQFGRELYD